MEFLSKFDFILEDLLMALGALVVLSTILVRLTPTKKDDEIVSKFKSFWLRVVLILPTLGVNPETKKMKEVIEQLKKEKEETYL